MEFCCKKFEHEYTKTHNVTNYGGEGNEYGEYPGKFFMSVSNEYYDTPNVEISHCPWCGAKL